MSSRDFIFILIGMPIGAAVWEVLCRFFGREFGGNWFVG